MRCYFWWGQRERELRKHQFFFTIPMGKYLPIEELSFLRSLKYYFVYLTKMFERCSSPGVSRPKWRFADRIGSVCAGGLQRLASRQDFSKRKRCSQSQSAETA